jgi:hypothetical protein
MGRYERRRFFESLVRMREWYRDRPDDDLPGPALSIDDAMIHAAATMHALEAEAAAPAEVAARADAAAAEAGADPTASEGATKADATGATSDGPGARQTTQPDA